MHEHNHGRAKICMFQIHVHAPFPLLIGAPFNSLWAVRFQTHSSVTLHRARLANDTACWQSAPFACII